MSSNRPFYKEQAEKYLKALFQESLDKRYGQIDLRPIGENEKTDTLRSSSIPDLLTHAEKCQNGKYNIFVSVNPKTGGGKKEHVKYVVTLHVDVDYGPLHKKPSKYATQQEALDALIGFEHQPSMIVHTGGGYHYYWILKEPFKVESADVVFIESINKGLSLLFGGDIGTQDISRILRVPGTTNFKENMTRNADLVSLTDKRYSLTDFIKYRCESTRPEKALPKEKSVSFNMSKAIPFVGIDINTLDIDDKWKQLITNGNDGTYPSRSEADMAVVTVLVKKGLSEDKIKAIYQDTSNGISGKYHEQSNPDQYLKRTIEAAKDFSDLTEQELLNPLFTKGAIIKKKRKTDSSYDFHLDITKYEEYIVKKHKMKYYDGAFFRFNGKCYESLETREDLNKLCQDALGQFRKLLTPNEFKNFIHFATGDILEDRIQAKINQSRYLTLNNGLFDVDTYTLVPHDSSIFTSNLLPYDYDPSADCPRFKNFLKEIFDNNEDTMLIIQEAVGYGFHKTIPTPAMFFLVGEGSNGKSVFLKAITALVGEKNVSNTGLSLMSDQYYVLKICGKMLNIAYENPTNRRLNMENIKAIVAGDRIPARSPYNLPIEFEPYAKHFFAMNEQPQINDSSYGTMRRIYIIDFPKIFSEDEADKTLINKLLLELPGIFNWAMEGYRRLRENKFVFHTSSRMRKSREDFREKSDSIYSFLSNRTAKSDSKVKLSEIYDAYVAYSHNEAYSEIQPRNQLSIRLKKNGYEIKNDTRDNNQVYVHGIRLVNKAILDEVESSAIPIESSFILSEIKF